MAIVGKKSLHDRFIRVWYCFKVSVVNHSQHDAAIDIIRGNRAMGAEVVDKGLAKSRHCETFTRLKRAARRKVLRTGNQLRAARVLLGMTQGEVAERAGVHLNTISAMEKRGRRIIAAGFDVTLRVVEALEAAGVIFLSGNGRGPGVVLKDESVEPVGTIRRKAKTPAAKKTRPRRSEPMRPTAH